MGIKLRQAIERSLAIILALLFVLPLVLTTIRRLPALTKLDRALDRAWLGEVQLNGVTTLASLLPARWGYIRHRDWQNSAAGVFNENFAGREALIRCTNELWFRIFDNTGNAALSVVVCEHDQLTEIGYVQEYFHGRITKEALEPWVRNLRRLQDLRRAAGQACVVVLTPGKLSIYPEIAPRCWRDSYDPRPRVHTVLTDLFREKGIIFVDAVDLVGRERWKNPPAPLFPKGGTHWNRRAALAAANAIQATFAQQGKPAGQIQIESSEVTDKPVGLLEAELVGVMNLMFPWRYPCESIRLRPAAKRRDQQMKMSVVSGSFGWELQRIFYESGDYQTVNLLWYYTLSKISAPPGLPFGMRAPAKPIDLDAELFAADCLLLEINEAVAVSPTHFLSVFVQEAIEHLEKKNAPAPAAASH